MATFTRRELYDLLWSRPRTKVAEQLGVTDTGLGHVCDKYLIPTPARGYWQRKRAGLTVRKSAYVPIEGDDKVRIEIFAVMPKAEDPAAMIVRKIREARQLTGKSGKVLQKRLSAGDALHNGIRKTAEVLRDPDGGLYQTHPLIEAVGRGLCGVKVSYQLVQRTISILQELAFMADLRKIAIGANETCISASVGPDKVTFTLTEHCTWEQVTYDPDQIENAMRRRQREPPLPGPRRKASGGVTVPSGCLRIEFETGPPALQSVWRDKEDDLIESRLDEVLDNIAARIEISRANRIADNERRAAAYQEYLRKENEAAREKTRLKREADIAALVLQAEQDYRRSVEMKEWVAELEARCHGRQEPELQQLLRWTRKQLARHEAAIEPENLVRNLLERGLGCAEPSS